MSQIHILDKYNFEVKEVLSNKQSKKVILEDTHKRNIENHTETYDFTVDYKASEFIENRDRIIIPDEQRGLYREFIVNKVETDTYYGETEVFSEASYLEDLQKAKAIAPQTLAENTPKTAMEFALRGTGWQVGEVEYAGFRTMSWTSYNTPYEVLKIIANRFSLQLDFTIETRGNKVTKRLVHLRNRKALFKGKEIRRGKDLAELKRSTISTDVVTALIALAPEPEDGKERLMVEVKDDEAQAKWGKSYNYLWGIYEPESDNSEMTKARLTTLATTELNKHNKPKVDYTIDAVSVEEQFPHEKVRIGDNVRIKDDLTEPYFYVDATVKEVTRNIFNKNSKTYVLGEIVEHKREDLRKHFNAMIAMLSKRLSETSSNIDNIVTIIDTAVERRIFRQPTPPENPTNGQLWLDTSNTNNAILKEYFNGIWVIRIESASEEDIESISRSTAMYESILTALKNFEVLHMQLLTEANIITTNKYLNQTNIDNINEKLQLVINTYNQLKSEVNKHSDSKRVTFEQANYIHQLMLNYSNAVKALQQAIGIAQNYAMEHLAILQAQYTDEKFTEAIEVTAERLGFIVEDDVIKLSPDSPVSDVIEALRQDTEDQFKSVVKQVDYDADKEGIVDRLNAADSERTQLSNEIKDRVTLTDYSKDKTEQTGRISTLETSVTQNGQAITLKANQDDLDSVERTLSTKQAQLEVKATEIESSVKGLNDDLAQAKTSINQSIDGITQQVSANKKGITDANSKIEQKANEITSEVNLVKEGISSGVVTYKDVDRTNWKNLVEVDGSFFDDAYSYDLSAKTVGTNTDSLIVSLISRGAGKGWDMSTREDDGTSAFRPNIYTITGGVRVRTAGTVTSRYSIDVAYTKYAGVGTGLSWTNSKITQTADEINSEVSKKVGNDEIISRINQSAEKISINASKVNISGNTINIGSNPAITGLNSSVGTAQSTANTAKSQADAARVGSNIANSINSAPSSVNINADRIKLTASSELKLAVDGLNNLGNSSNMIRKSIVSEENLQYFVNINGGSNVDTSISTLDGHDYFLARAVSGDSPSYVAVQVNRYVTPMIKWEKNKSYKLSFKARSSSRTTDFLYTYIMRNDGANQSLGRPTRITPSEGLNESLYEFDISPNWDSDQGYLLIGLTGETTGYWMRIRDIMLQEGTVSTPYQPHSSEIVGKGNLMSSINLDDSGVSISGNKISLTGTAEFNSAFGSSRGITAISGGRIETDSMRAKQIEILRSDGAVYMNNGIPNMSMDLQRNQLHHPSAVSFDGQNYVYNASNMTGYEMYSCESIYTTHHSRYITINFGVNLFAGANSIQALVELAEFGGGSKVVAGQYLVRQSDSTDYYSLTLDLGKPSYSSKQFYVRAGMQSAASANRLRVRVNRVYMWG